MQQSNIIFGTLVIAFIVFITVRGELPTYISLLRGSGKQGAAGASAASGGNDIISGATSLLSGGGEGTDFLTQLAPDQNSWGDIASFIGSNIPW